MSDLILLGALRAPMPGYPCPTMTLRQLVERAREAADRIEADAAKLEGLRAEVEALREFYKASSALVSTLGHLEATAEDENRAEARYEAAKRAVAAMDRAAIDAAKKESGNG